MEQASEKRQSAITFWKEYKTECLPIKSVKEVFGKYKTYCDEKKFLPLNEYVFRTYIRKNGYCNSGEKKKKKRKENPAK